MSNLYQCYFYQNSKTNQASSSAISTKQICRLLCPVVSSSSASVSIIHADTLIIEYDQVTNQYNTTQGWVPISSIPLFQFASASWYYSTFTSDGDADLKSSNDVVGPISCRELAKVYYQDPPIIQDDKTRVWSSVLTKETRSSSDNDEEGDATWTLLSQVPLLKLAMEAFEDIVNVTFFADDDKNTQDVNNDKNQPSQNQSGSSDFQFNEADMIYDDDDRKASIGQEENNGEEDEMMLQEFLSSTGEDRHNYTLDQGEDEEEEYHSDGGTNYVKFRNQWVDVRLVPKTAAPNKRQLPSSSITPNQQQLGQGDDATQVKKKSKNSNSKPKFTNKNAKHWVYVTNLPLDTNEIEVAAYFSKVGILDIDPETQKPKIKLYMHNKDGDGEIKLKGDASICYAKIESVELAIQLLDDTIFRTTDPKTNQPLNYELANKQKKISVQKAKFEQKTDSEYLNKNVKKKSVSDKKRHVARLAKLQAITWDEGDYNGRITGGKLIKYVVY